MMWGYGPGMAWMVFMPLVWLVLVGLIVWAVVWLVRGGLRGAGNHDRRDTPEETLDRRFAAGEIDEETYRQAREALTQRHRAPPR
ncbi:SHOCT domain-containing protein [Saccharopolyspora phatthalungensis]|nr:SHOCT domain-containing protein [Saccharopolyspora phatthalungensis]